MSNTSTYGWGMKINSLQTLSAGQKYLADYFEKHRNFTFDVYTESERTGTLPMLGLWMMWMGEIAEFMAARGITMPLYITPSGAPHGSRPFNKTDAHEMFTIMFLGQNEKGERYSWSKSKVAGPVADKGHRLHAMEQMQAYSVEKGISLSIPEKSEFFKLQKKTQGQ